MLYAVDRDDGAGVADRLIIIDETTGTADPNAFGAGIGYISVTDNNPGTVWDTDIDDLAIDPTDGNLYGIANAGGIGDHLIRIDRVTGALTDLGVLNVSDMEGLGFFNDGTLYGVTGDSSSLAVALRDSLWEINIGTAIATQIAPFASGEDYESVDCLVGDPNNKSGFVYNDANNNAIFEIGELPLNGITIEIYRDDGLINDAIDVNDTLLATTTTDINGMYDFNMAAIGKFILQVDIATLPAGYSIADNVEIAIFNACNPGAFPYDDLGCDEPDNNFPASNAVLPPTLTPTPTNTPLPTNTSVPPPPPLATIAPPVVTNTPVGVDTALPGSPPLPTNTPIFVPVNPPPLVVAPNTAILVAQSSAPGGYFSLRKVAEPNTVSVGDTLTFRLEAANLSTVPISNLVITDNVPSIYEIIDVSTTVGVASVQGNDVRVTIRRLQPGQSVLVRISVRTLRVAFAPDSCNFVTYGGTDVSQACPNIFPDTLPNTGETMPVYQRLLMLLVALGVVMSGLRFALSKKE